MSKMSQAEYMRAYRLPEMIERAEAKLARLYAEQDGREVQLKDTRFFHQAWEGTVRLEKLRAESRGEVHSVGDQPCA